MKKMTLMNIITNAFKLLAKREIDMVLKTKRQINHKGCKKRMTADFFLGSNEANQTVEWFHKRTKENLKMLTQISTIRGKVFQNWRQGNGRSGWKILSYPLFWGQKQVGGVAQWQTTCLAHASPWVQTPAL